MSKTPSRLCAFVVGCAVFAGVAGAACRKADRSREPVITIEHEIAPAPPRVGAAMITLRIADASGKPLTGVPITLEGNMSHAGMAPVFATTKETEPGRYQAPLEFSMGGDWIVLIHLALADGTKLERQFEIRGVLP